MGNIRFNHMELTLPLGTLTDEFRAQAREFYGDVFGWTATDTQILNQTALLLSTDAATSQFILLIEHREPMAPPPFDHLGVLCDSREEVGRHTRQVRSMAGEGPACGDQAVQRPSNTDGHHSRLLCAPPVAHPFGCAVHRAPVRRCRAGRTLGLG